MKAEKEVKIITSIFFIPELNYFDNPNANNAVNAIMYQLGSLNCESNDDYAIIKYNGILSKDAKQKLIDIVKQYGHSIVYIEAENETPFVDCDTIHIPTNDEMKEHLNRN